MSTSARAICVAALAATALIGTAGSAGAATTIGQTFTPNTGCAASTFIQSVSPGGSYAAPTPGVITSWSYQADISPPSQLRMKVARAVGGNSFLIVGQSDLEPQLPGALKSFTTRISVQAGDVIGFYESQAANCLLSASGYGYHYLPFQDPAPSSTPVTFQPGSTFQLDLAATLEPDADNDGFGDETQDKCVGTAGTFNGCPNTLTIDSAKQKDGKPKVEVTATVPGAGVLEVGSANDASLASASAAPGLKAMSQTITATSKQQVTVTLKLTKSAKQKLASKGKLKTQVRVVYRPTGGPAGSQTRKVKLKG